jgi:amino-acid N-acetyltransferase
VLPRRIEEVYQTLREWVVAEEAGQVVGCGALVILWADLAEIRSLVVAPEAQGAGLGRGLVSALMVQAVELELPQVFALTRKTGFFLKLGFQVVPRDSLPRKIWKDCITCTKFVGCDEVAAGGGEDGRMEGWKDGRVEGWKDGQSRALRSSGLPVFQSSNLPTMEANGHNVTILVTPPGAITRVPGFRAAGWPAPGQRRGGPGAGGLRLPARGAMFTRNA